LKDLLLIDKQIKTISNELDAIDARRAELQDKIKQLWSLRNSITDEGVPTIQLPEVKVTNESLSTR
jgi:hypothetical protein